MSFFYVKAHHGPCFSFHTFEHKPQKLAGLRDRLIKLGFRVDLIPVDHINYCMLEMCGHEVFRCNLLNLNFNTHHDRDPVCQRAVEAVLQSSQKFQQARVHLWFWALIDRELFKRGPYAPKDYWPEDVNVDIKPFVSCDDCVKCCNILIRKKEKKEPDVTKNPVVILK